MTVLNLPPLGLGGEFPIKPDAGKWNGADGTLKQLGRALRVNREEAFRDPDEAIRAIPDPWAQARTFGEALLDPRHSMHRRARSQWRGLLALFALQQFHLDDYRLELRKLDLAADKHILNRVLLTLRPEVAVQGQAGLWATPWIVLLAARGQKPEPLAMTNPICLVSPGRRSHRIEIAGVGWADGELRDPVGAGAEELLPAPQIVALRDWLRTAHADLTAFPGPLCDALCELVAGYARDCGDLVGTGVELKTVIGEPTRRDLPGLFQPLLRTARLEPPTDAAALSQTRVRLRGDLDYGKLRGIIFVDRSIADLPAINPRTCFVWGMRTLSELLRSPRLLATVREEAAACGYLIMSAEDLFTQRAVRLENEALIAGHPAGLQDMLVPIRPVAMLLAGTVRDNVTAESTPTRASVTIQLRLERDTGEDVAAPVTRHFTEQPAGDEGLFVPAVEWGIQNASLWPDFRSPAWHSYFIRFLYPEARKGVMARPTHALSSALIVGELIATETAHAAITRLRALNDGRLPADAEDRFLRSELATAQQYEDVQFSTSAFEAIVYVEGTAKRGAAGAGLVLLDLPLRAPANRGATIAVDFGTTNTVAAIQGDDEALSLTFRERLVIPVRYRSPERTHSAMHNARFALSGFLPPQERSLPTPTVALGRIAYPNNEKISLFRNFIYFHSNEPYPENDEKGELERFKNLRNRAKFNLKWSADPAVAEAATDFLEQFMLMTLAETLDAGFDPRLTRWRFSVPDALSSTRRESFELYLARATSRLSSHFVETANERALAPLYSEGLSAARYMIARPEFNANALNIVLDIGGGTTDATIWDREDIKWRGSFLLAGQNFFTMLICRNPQILREIGLGQWASLLEAAETLGTDVPHLAEMLFSGTGTTHNGLDLQRAIDTYWETRLNGKVGDVLRITGLVFVAGMSWYLGRVVKQLIADGKIGEQIASLPAFSLCGRGAGLFKKIHGDRSPDSESALTRALQVFGTAAGIPGNPMPEVRATKLAKLEVVRGMLADDSYIDASIRQGARLADNMLPAGLGLTYRGGGNLVATELIAATPPDKAVDQVDLAEFEAFLAELGARAEIDIDLCGARRGGARAYIENAVRADAEAARRDKTLRRAPEPPFIAALRALIAELAAAPQKRDGRIEMGFRE